MSKPVVFRIDPPLTDAEVRQHQWTRLDVSSQAQAHQAWCKLHAKDPKLSPFHLRNARLAKLDLSNIEFGGMDMSSADLRESTLKGAGLSYANASKAKFHRCTLTAEMSRGGQTTMSGFLLVGAKGLFDHDGAIIEAPLSYAPLDPPIHQAWGAGTRLGDFPNWRTLSAFGELPIFGVSNLTLAALIAYGGVAQWYNLQLASLQTKLNVTPEQMQELVQRLHPIPSPRHLGYLLLILTMLSTASLIYKVFCPDIVKEFSPIRWSQEGKDMVPYWSADYSYAWWRRTCGLLYLVFGSWAAFYLLSRLYHAFQFYLI